MKDRFRIFDTHVHIGTARHSGRRHTVDMILREMDRFGVDRAVAIPFPVVDDYRREHDEIGAAVQAHPDRLAGAACLNPFVPENEYRGEVRRCREEYGFRALKLQPQYQGVNPLYESSSFLFETALENRLTLIVHTGSGVPFSLPSLYILPAHKYPDLKLVLAHCGGGGLFFSEAIVAATLCSNIYLELSSLLPHQILEVLRYIPSDRLMAGSDLPENLDIEMLKVIQLPVPDQDKQNILYGTGCRVFQEGC